MESSSWLCCDTVEQLQQAAEAGRPTSEFLARLEGATLAGLLEYGCARWHCRSLPPLPSALTNSTAGMSLQKIRSGLGVRSTGDQKLPSRSLFPEVYEFFALEGEDPTTLRAWNEFLLRFRQSAKSIGFSHNQAQGIAAAFGEMADNATIHSRSPIGTLVGYSALNGAATFCVADVGIGVLGSLRECKEFVSLRSHTEALRTALQDGATCRGNGNGGFGFRQIFKSLTNLWGTLRFRSGEGCLTMDGTGLDANLGTQDFVVHRPGFQVTICCRTGPKSGLPLL